MSRDPKHRQPEAMCREPQGIPGQCGGCKRNAERRPEAWSDTPSVNPQVRNGVCAHWLALPWGGK